MRFFKLVMILLLKIYATENFFFKNNLSKNYWRYLFFQYVVWNQWRDTKTKSFGGWWYPPDRETSNLWNCRENPLPPPGSSPPFLPLVRHPDPLITKTLRRVLGPLTVMILKRMSESVYFQSNKFTACKIKDEKDVANSFMTFNLPKIIHPFQVKKHLRT